MVQWLVHSAPPARPSWARSSWLRHLHPARVAAVLALGVAVLVVLTVDRRPLEAQPAPDAQTYAGLARTVADPGAWGEQLAGALGESRYPPGFPLLLAPFSGLDLTVVAVGFTAALVVAVWCVAYRLAGGGAAAVAALVLATSGSLQLHASWVMADVPTAMVTVLALAAAAGHRHRLAGVLLAASVTLRLSSLPGLLGLRRQAWVPAGAVLVALLASKVLLGWGYTEDQVGWDAANLWSTAGLAIDASLPNGVAYPAMLLGLHAGLLPVGALPLAVWGAWKRPERRLVLAVVAGSLALYLPYSWQAQRFMLPVAAVIALYAGIGATRAGDAADTWARRRRGAGQAAGPSHRVMSDAAPAVHSGPRA